MRRRFRFKSLRSKIVAWSFVPAAIILIAVALVAFYAYQQVAEDLVVERNRDLARLSAGQLADELAEYPALLTEWAQTAGVYARSPAAAQNALKKAGNRFVVFDGGVFLLDWRGVVVAAEPQRPDLAGQDWSEQPFFRQAALTRRPVLSGVITTGFGLDLPAAAGGEPGPAVVVAAPILAGPVDLHGVVAGTFRLGATAISSLYGSIVKLHIGGNDTVYLVDGDGRVIYHSDPERVSQDLSSQGAVQQVLAGRGGAFRTRSWTGQEIVASFAPVPGTSWGLVIEADWGALLRASGGYRRLLVGLLVLGVVLPAIVVAVGVRHITRPIADLMAAAQEVAAGNLGHTVEATTGDELEELGKQFNAMSGQLAASYSALQAAYQTLEQSVENRTHELATLNAISAVVSRSLDLHEILRDALVQTIDTLDMETGVAYRLAGDPAGQDDLFLEPLEWQGISRQAILSVSPIAVRGTAFEAAASSGQPLVWDAQAADLAPSVGAMLEREEIRQVVSVPLMAGGKWVGAIFIGTGRPRPFTPEQITLLAAVGQQVGVAMENARLYEAERAGHAEAERRQQVAEGMRDIMSILNSNRSPREILDYIVQQASRLLAADAGFIVRFEPDGRWQTFAASHAWPDDLANVAGGVLADTAGNRRLLNRQAMGIGDLRAYVQAEMDRLGGQVPSATLTWYTRMSQHFGAVLAAPLLVQDALYGAMALYYGQARQFGDEDYRLGMTLADQIALALENAQLRAQAEQAAASAERSRLARDLHDSVTQNLYCLTLYSEAAARQLLAGEHQMAAEYLRDLRDTAQEALREMRLLIFELRPPALEKSGLVGALQARLDAVEKRGGLQVELRVTGVEALAGGKWLSLSLQEELYHVAQEALNNSLKHARAQRVQVCLDVSPRDVRLELADDGLGFEPATAGERGGLGLAGMRERVQRVAGQLHIDSAPGQGTRIAVTVSRQA